MANNSHAEWRNWLKAVLRNHPSDGRKRLIGTHARAGCGEPERDPTAAAFDGACQGAVVDNLASYRLHAAGLRQRPRTNQYASARRTCIPAPRITNPRRRVKHEKEKYEGRNQQLLRKTPAVQLHHERDEIVAAGQPGRSKWQPYAARARCRHRSATGNPEKSSSAMSTPCLTAHNFPDQPGGSGSALMTVSEADLPASAAAARGDGRGGVGTVVVNQKDVDTLIEQRYDAGGNESGLVARGYNGGHSRGASEQARGTVGDPSFRTPETASGKHQ